MKKNSKNKKNKKIKCGWTNIGQEVEEHHVKNEK